MTIDGNDCTFQVNERKDFQFYHELRNEMYEKLKDYPIYILQNVHMYQNITVLHKYLQFLWFV